jgi:putative hydroxymethylpyrimidine transport system substrate-binding protein
MHRLLIAAALAAVVAGCAAGGGGSDRPERSASLLLDFTPNGVHAGIYSATGRGYDDAEGVALRVRAPSSGTDSTKLLAAGRTDFAILDLHDLAIARERGRDVVAVMAIVQRPLASVLAQPGVDRPRDLEGRRVGVTGLPSDDAVLRSIVEGDGGDADRVDTVTIGFNAVQSLLADKVAAATAFWNVEGVAFRERRPRGKVFRLEEFGAPPYPELVLATSRSTLRDSPSLVRATVQALIRGYRFTLTDPQSSAQDLLARNRGLERSEIERQIAVLDAAFVGASGRVGALEPAALRRWARWEGRSGIVRDAPDVGAMFAPRFADEAREPEN